MFPVIVLLLFAVADAQFTVQSTFINNFLAPSKIPGLGNQTVAWQQNSLTLRCDSTNFFDTGLQVGPNFYAIECQPPLYSFDTVLQGFVPSYGTLYTTQICQVPSPSAFGNTNLTSAVPISPLGRRLLSFGSFVSSIVGTQGANFLTGEACVATLGTISSVGVNCNGDNNSPNPQWIAQLNALSAFAANVSKFDTATAIALGAQKGVNLLVNQTLLAMNKKIGDLATYAFTLNQTVYATLVNEDKKFNLTQVYLQKAFKDISLLGAQTVQNTASTITLQNAVINNFNAVLNMTNLMQRNTAATNLANARKFATATQLIKQLAVTLKQSLLMTGTKNSITAGISQHQAVAISKGEVLYVDPAQPGVAPATSFPQSLLKLSLDVSFLNYITAFGGVNTNHQYGYNVYCNADRYQVFGYDAIDYLDFPNLIGPQNCASASSASALLNCLCWVEISHKTCAAPLSPLFTWQQIKSKTRAAYTLTAGSAMCTGVISAGANDGIRISDSGSFYNLIGQWCSVQLAASPANQYQLVSYRIGVANLIQTPRSWVANICNMDLTNIFETNQYVGSLPFSIITNLMLAYTVMGTDANTILQYQQGLQPSYVTYTYMPFETLPDNNTYSCYRASIMGVSTKTKPVFSLSPSIGNAVTTTVVSTAYDRPPTSCTGFSCNFGNVVSVQQTNSASVSVPLQNLLPQAGDVIIDVIQPLGSSPTTTHVYDAPRGSTPFEGPLQSAKGALTYMLQPVPAGFNLATANLASSTVWPPTAMLNTPAAANYNPRISSSYFNHEDASFTIDQVFVPLDNQEMCIVPSGLAAQWLCSLLANFNVNPLTNMRRGKFVVAPDVWSYVVTLNVVMGEVVQRVYPGCPDLSFQAYGPSLVSFILTNSLPQPIDVVVRLKSSSGLCQNPGDKLYNLLAKQVFQQSFPTCGNQTIQLFQDGATGLLSCGPPISINVNASAQAVLQGTTAIYNQTFIETTFISQATGVILAAAKLMQTLIPYLSPVTANLTVIQREQAINASFLAFIAEAAALSTQQLLGNVSAVDVYNKYAPSLGAAADAYNKDSAAVLLDLTKLSNQMDVFSADVAIVKQDAVNVNKSVINLIKADDALIAAIQAMQDGNSGGATCAGCPEIPLIYQLCCAIDNFGQFLANILLYGAVISVCLGLGYLLYRVIRHVQAKEADKKVEDENRQSKVERQRLLNANSQTAGTAGAPPGSLSGQLRAKRYDHSDNP